MVHYFGIGAQNTYEGLGRLHLLEVIKPDLTIVAFGANDLAHDTLPPEGTARALELIVQRLRDTVSSEVVAMAASTGGPDSAYWFMVEPLFSAQRAICAQYDVPYIDTHAELLHRLQDGETWLRFFPSADDCHPNDEGHRLWGEMLFETVKAEVNAERGFASNYLQYRQLADKSMPGGMRYNVRGEVYASVTCLCGHLRALWGIRC